MPAQRNIGQKREEISLVFDILNAYLINSKGEKSPRVLEFGCGNGFQIPYLKKIGLVFSCDIDIRLDVKKLYDDIFKSCY